MISDNRFPMKRDPGPGASEREQLRWAQQENVRLNQGKDRLAEEVDLLLNKNRRLVEDLSAQIAHNATERNAHDQAEKLKEAYRSKYLEKLKQVIELRNQLGDATQQARSIPELEQRVEGLAAQKEKFRSDAEYYREKNAENLRDKWKLQAELRNVTGNRISSPCSTHERKLAAAEEELKAVRYQLERTRKTVEEYRKVCDKLAAERDQLKSELTSIRREPFLVKDQQKTIHELVENKQELKLELARKSQTIRQQGNKLRQMRDSRNLWYTRAKKFEEEKAHVSALLSRWRNAYAQNNLVPAETQAEVEAKIMKRIKKAMKKGVK